MVNWLKELIKIIKKHGKFVEVLYNGDKYERNYINGKVNGFAVMYFASGTKYIGVYNKGLNDFVGTIEWATGTKHAGSLKNKEWNGY